MYLVLHQLVMDNLNVSRRHLLGTAIISPLAGCTALGSESGVQLGNIQIGNTEDEPLTFKLRLERDGSLIYLERIQVDAGDIHTIERTWDSESGEFSVFYSSSFEDAIHRLSIPSENESIDGDCVDMQFHCHSNTTDSVVYDEDQPEWTGC